MGWLVDPTTNTKSVTLTLMVIAFTAAMIGAGLEIAAITKTTSILMEMFVGCLSTYLGRRITFGKNTGSSEPTTENK